MLQFPWNKRRKMVKDVKSLERNAIKWQKDNDSL